MDRHGNKGAMRHGRNEHAGTKLFGGKTETSKSAPVGGRTGGSVNFGHSKLVGPREGAGHAGQPDGKGIGIGSSNPSLGMADHHGPGRSGLTGATHSFRGVKKSPTAGEYHHGGHRIGKK